MGFEDWDIIGQGTSSLTTITTVVKQTEGDKYVIDVKVDTQGYVRDEDVPNLKFELGVESNTEDVRNWSWLCQCMLNSCFPMRMQE